MEIMTEKNKSKITTLSQRLAASGLKRNRNTHTHKKLRQEKEKKKRRRKPPAYLNNKNNHYNQRCDLRRTGGDEGSTRRTLRNKNRN